MRSLYTAVALLCLCVFLIQCQKEVSYIGNNETNTFSPQPIIAHLQGNIIDENGLPASGVSIKVGSKSAITDADGYFRILQASLDKSAALVTAEKPGYFKACRSFAATSGTNQVFIKLIKRDLAGTLSGNAGGDVTLSNGTKIGLKANGVVVASTGIAYSGTINIYAAPIDPTSSDIRDVVPGSFMANNLNGNRVALSSYGMVAVELEGAAGEKLQIRPGYTATLTIPIPSSLQSTAPATIPMWWLDEKTGIWKEEGTGTKSGTNYVGDVKHFSFWNYDFQMPAVMLSMTIKNSDGVPLTYTFVDLTMLSSSGAGHAGGHTDSLGQVSGLVPKNATFQLSLRTNCGNMIFVQSVGPLSSNTDLGTIIVPSSTSSVVTIQGQLLTCAGTPVSNGFALIMAGGTNRYASTDASGNYQASFIICGSGNIAQILGTDATNHQQGNLQTINIVTPQTNVPPISVCGTSSVQYINYALDGGPPVNISSTVPSDSLEMYSYPIGGQLTFLSGHKNLPSGLPNGQDIYFTSTSPTAAIGTYPLNQITVNSIQGNTVGLAMNVTYTSFPTVVGGFYEGTFSGSFASGSPAVSHTLTGQFKLRKNF
jgi:hypothetical protein